MPEIAEGPIIPTPYELVYAQRVNAASAAINQLEQSRSGDEEAYKARLFSAQQRLQVLTEIGGLHYDAKTQGFSGVVNGAQIEVRVIREKSKMEGTSEFWERKVYASINGQEQPEEEAQRLEDRYGHLLKSINDEAQRKNQKL